MTTNSDRGIFALSVSELGPTLQALQKHGVTLAHLAMLRTDNGDNDYAKRFARALTRDGFQTSTDTRIARLILGASFFDVPDWVVLYGARFSRKEVREALKFPWHEDVLMSTCLLCGKTVKDCHFAFWGIEKLNDSPLTVVKWNELHPPTGQPKFYFSTDPWHAGQPHTDVATMQSRWDLIHQDIVPDSTRKNPGDQVKMLPPEYEASTTIAEVMKDILVFRKTGERPNPKRWAACAERTIKTNKVSAGNISCVGYFNENGLVVNDWDGNPYGNIGVGASRNFLFSARNTPPLRRVFLLAVLDRFYPAAQHSAYFIHILFQADVFFNVQYFGVLAKSEKDAQ